MWSYAKLILECWIVFNVEKDPSNFIEAEIVLLFLHNVNTDIAMSKMNFFASKEQKHLTTTSWNIIHYVCIQLIISPKTLCSLITTSNAISLFLCSHIAKLKGFQLRSLHLHDTSGADYNKLKRWDW